MIIKIILGVFAVLFQFVGMLTWLICIGILAAIAYFGFYVGFYF